MKKKTNSLAVKILVAVLVGVAGFYGGMQYQKGQGIAGDAQFANQAGPGGQRMMRFQGGQNGQGNQTFRNGANRPVSGEIISQDASSITVKMQDGSTKNIILSDKTTINKSEAAAKSDLKNGEQVTVFGTTNADGSVTAQMVSMGQMMFFRGGPGSGFGSQKPSGQPEK